jgi:hypothetical protein
MTEDNLFHADAEPDLSQSGQQPAVPTGKTPSIDSPEEAAFAKWVYTIFTVCGVAKEARFEFLERFQAFKEAAANAVIEECAAALDQRTKENDYAPSGDSDFLRSLKSSPGRVVDRTASIHDQHPVEPNNLGDPQ